MKKTFSILAFAGLLGVISSCDPMICVPMNEDKLGTNIIDFPIETDSAKLEISHDGLTQRCHIFLNLPEGCEVNEDSLIITLNEPNYSSGKIEKIELRNLAKPLPLRVSKIAPSHEIRFCLYKSKDATGQNKPTQMYLKMSGVIIKDGKSIINDTLKVNLIPNIIY